jgi:hypothetical protein
MLPNQQELNLSMGINLLLPFERRIAVTFPMSMKKHIDMGP